MWIRVLTAWSGSPPCGEIADLPDALARAQIQAGHAEPAQASARVPAAPETTMVTPGERAIKPRGRARKTS
jgi:hypothetical protein